MLRELRWHIHTLGVFYSLKKSNIGRQYEIRKLKNPDYYKYSLWKIKTLKSLMILFTLLHSPWCKSLLSLHTPALVIYCWPPHIWQYAICRLANRKSLCKRNYPQIFVSSFGAGFSSNCGNHVYNTFFPAWVNLVWCLLQLRKSAPLEDICLLRYFLMLQSSRNAYTFYSATGFEQQAFYTCPQRIQNSSIWEKSNLIPILAQPLNPLLYFYSS